MVNDNLRKTLKGSLQILGNRNLGTINTPYIISIKSNQNLLIMIITPAWNPELVIIKKQKNLENLSYRTDMQDIAGEAEMNS